MTTDATRDAVSGSAQDLLRIYLSDHLAGAAAGVKLADRVARANETRPAGRELALIAQQIHEDHESLLTIMRRSPLAALIEPATALTEPRR